VSFLEDLQNEMPDRNRILYILALTVIGAALLGDLALVGVSIVPNWRSWQEVNDQSQQVRAEMERAQNRRDARTPEDVQALIDVAEEELARRAGLFLSEARAAEVLNRLYHYAGESGTRIVSLESQPVPIEGDEVVVSPLYEIRRFHLVVRGTVPDLLVFVGLLEEVGEPGLVVSDVVIGSDEEMARLEMNASMVVSSYAEPDDPEVIEGADMQAVLLEAWESQGWQQVIDVLSELLETDPDNEAAQAQLHTAYVNYGEQLLQEGKPGLAGAQFELALQIEPDSAEALSGLAQADPSLSSSGRAKEGLIARLDAAWAADDWAEAIWVLEKLRTAEPASGRWTDKLYRAYINYGYELSDTGALTDAKEVFSAALEIKPDGAEAAEGLRLLAEQPAPTTGGEAPVP